MAAPIHAPDGSIVGAVDLSTSVEDGRPERLTLVAHVAYVIEQLLAQGQALAAAETSEKRFRRTFEDAPIGMSIIRPDFTIADINKAFCAMLGYRHEELVGRSFLEITHPDDAEKDSMLAALAFKGEIPSYRIDKRYVTKWGETLWGRLTATIVRDGQGTPLYGVGMVENAQEVRQSEQKLRAILDTTQAVIYLIDAQDRFLQINRQFGKVLGVPEDSVVGRNIHDFLPRRLADQMARNNRLAFEARQTTESEEALPWPQSARTYLTVRHPLFEADGKPYAICGVATDITERMRELDAVRLLSETSKVFDASLDLQETLAAVAKLLVGHLGDVAVIDLVGEDGVPRRVSAACSDVSKSGIVEELRQVVPSLDAQAGAGRVLRTRVAELRPELHDAALREMAFSEAHLEILRRLRPQSAIIVPMVVRGGVRGSITLWSTRPERRFRAEDLALAQELAHRAAIAVDNAQLYEASQEMVRQRDEFISIASHELRTPLTTLLLELELLRREGVHAETCMAQANRLAALVAQLLDMTRIRAGRMVLERSEMSLTDLVGRVVRLSSDPAKVSVAAVGPVRGCWDRLRLEQVFTNLISNALKYGDGKAVEVSVSASADRAVVEVADRGAGMSEEELGKLFRPFQRGDKVGGIQGLGLGLFIAQQIVHAHGGLIAARSRRGQGSVFTVSLPLQCADSSTAS